MKESKQVEWNVLATIDYICTHTKRKKLNYEKSPKMIKYLENLKHYFGDINEIQVIILCAILDINLSNIKNMTLNEYFEISTMTYLQHNGEIEELDQKNILSVDIKENGHKYTINTNIVTSILRNQEIHFETETLDPVSFVTEISEIIESGSSSYDERIIKARSIENKNKKLSFVQELMNILPYYKDRFCFYLLCYYYTQDWTLSFQRLFHSVYFHSAQKNMQLMLSEKHELIKKDFVTFIKKGNVMDSTLSITDKSKHFFLGDDEYLYEKNFNEKAIIIPEAINKKELFYNEENQNQINMIYNFLNENNLSNIQNGLKAKGFPTGICILLYGAPGTGKTESVYQIAKSTNRSIIHVDISQTKSCWFGESEKKIQDVFDNYNRLCKKLQVNGKKELPILLFNEADAIIQKRTEFSGGGTEKTENAMQNILLENLEKFEGVLIATTNLEINMDAAFERRFLYKIKFENPTVEAKTAIWKSKLNWISEEKAKQLAKEYDFSGGEIDNIVRKATMEEILNGSTITINRLKELCNTEKLISSNSDKKIGFYI